MDAAQTKDRQTLGLAGSGLHFASGLLLYVTCFLVLHP